MTYIIKAIETIPLYDDDERTVITKDKIYETDGFYKSIGDHLSRESSDDLVKIMCDDGYMRHLKVDLFIRIDLLREEKLNELLNDTVNDAVNDTVNVRLLSFSEYKLDGISQDRSEIRNQKLKEIGI